VLDPPRRTLLPTLEVRLEVIQIMREFNPTCQSLRPWDSPRPPLYRCVVQDALNMVIVGNLLPYVPKLSYIPVMVYLWDHIPEALSVIPDVLVDVMTAVYEQKMDALHRYTSQMYEWLDHPQSNDPERRAWLKKKPKANDQSLHALPPETDRDLRQEKGEKNPLREAFEVCEYGAPLTPRPAAGCFPFI